MTQENIKIRPLALVRSVGGVGQSRNAVRRGYRPMQYFRVIKQPKKLKKGKDNGQRQHF